MTRQHPDRPHRESTRDTPKGPGTLESRLRHDADPWRQAIDSGEADRVVVGGDRRWVFAWTTVAPLAAAAGLALAVSVGMNWLAGDRPTPSPSSAPVETRSSSVTFPHPAPLHALEQAPPLDQPMVSEADRMAQDARRAVSFVMAELPGPAGSAGEGGAKPASPPDRE